YRNALKIRPQLQLLVEVFDIVHETRNRTENLCVRVLLVAGRIKVRGNNIHLGIDAAPVCRKVESWQMIARIAFLEIEVGYFEGGKLDGGINGEQVRHNGLVELDILGRRRPVDEVRVEEALTCDFVTTCGV